MFKSTAIVAMIGLTACAIVPSNEHIEATPELTTTECPSGPVVALISSTTTIEACATAGIPPSSMRGFYGAIWVRVIEGESLEETTEYFTNLCYKHNETPKECAICISGLIGRVYWDLP